MRARAAALAQFCNAACNRPPCRERRERRRAPTPHLVYGGDEERRTPLRLRGHFGVVLSPPGYFRWDLGSVEYGLVCRCTGCDPRGSEPPGGGRQRGDHRKAAQTFARLVVALSLSLLSNQPRKCARTHNKDHPLHSATERKNTPEVRQKFVYTRPKCDSFSFSCRLMVLLGNGLGNSGKLSE